MRSFDSVSASQINRYLDCPRQWWFASILQLPTPTKPSAALGIGVHEHLEKYLQTGQKPDDLSETGRIASVGLIHLPEPGTVMTELDISATETGKSFQLAGLKVNGYIDVLNLAADPPEVLDHKTTSDLKWAKTAEELKEDPQITIYTRFAFLFLDNMGTRTEVIKAGHVVYLTKGVLGSRRTDVEITRGHNAKKWTELGVLVEKMKISGAAKVPQDVEARLSSCDKYGGCAFRDHCKRLGSFAGSDRPFQGIENVEVSSENQTGSGGLKMSAALDALKRLKAGQVGLPLGAPTGAPETNAAARPAPTPAPTPPPAPAPAAAPPALTKEDVLRQLGLDPPKPDVGAAANVGSGIVPPDAPANVDPAALLARILAAGKQEGGGEVSEASQGAEGEGSEKTRKPRKALTRILALGWAENQIGRMNVATMHEILDGKLGPEGRSVLPDGRLILANGVPADQQLPNEPGPGENVQIPAPATAGAAPAVGSGSGLTVYVDCYPSKGPDADARKILFLEDYLQPAMREASQIEKVIHYALIEYGKGPHYMAAAILAKPPTGIVVCNTRFPATNAVLEVLLPMADIVVRAR